MTHSFSSQMTAQMKAMHEEQFGHDLSCSEIFDKMQADPGTDKWQTFMLSMAYRSQSEIEEREARHATAPASTATYAFNTQTTRASSSMLDASTDFIDIQTGQAQKNPFKLNGL